MRRVGDWCLSIGLFALAVGFVVFVVADFVRTVKKDRAIIRQNMESCPADPTDETEQSGYVVYMEPSDEKRAKYPVEEVEVRVLPSDFVLARPLDEVSVDDPGWYVSLRREDGTVKIIRDWKLWLTEEGELWAADVFRPE